jgi:hypothetical protein
MAKNMMQGMESDTWIWEGRLGRCMTGKNGKKI